MTQSLSRPKLTVALAGVVCFLILAVSFDNQAKDPSPPATGVLKVLMIKASYVERERGNVFSIACALVNDGDSDLTVVTEHLNLGGPSLDKKANTLRCALLFDDSMTFQEKPVVPSLYRHAPVTLRPGEATIVHYARDFSGLIGGGRSMDPDDLEAETVTLSYSIAERWGKRFDLWHGEQKGDDPHI